jgi:hypothetical protein
MPSISHDGPIDVIRNHPEMTADLVRRVTPIKIPAQDRLRVELGSSDASHVVPDEFRADLVTVIRDADTGDPLLLVVIESQGRMTEEKEFAWPACLANLRATHRCKSAVLIVICWDPAEAERCRAAIPTGHPDHILIPIVIGPHDGQELTGASPWLTILAASMGAGDLTTDSGRQAVLDAIRDTGSDVPLARTLITIILAVASDAARVELEALMQTSEYKNDFLDGIEARAAARGEALGEARGEARGQARGEAKALVRVLNARKIELTSEQQELIGSCMDSDQLDLWLDRALVATSADELFGD